MRLLSLPCVRRTCVIPGSSSTFVDCNVAAAVCYFDSQRCHTLQAALPVSSYWGTMGMHVIHQHSVQTPHPDQTHLAFGLDLNPDLDDKTTQLSLAIWSAIRSHALWIG